MEVSYTIEVFKQAFGAGTPDDTAAALTTAVNAAAGDGTLSTELTTAATA